MSTYDELVMHERRMAGQWTKMPTGTEANRPSVPEQGMIRYNTSSGVMENYNANGWTSIDAPPIVSNATPTSLDDINDVVTITGSNFTTSVTVKFIGQDGTEYPAKSVTRVSSSELQVTRPDTFPVANGPYSIVVINSSGLQNTIGDAVDAGGIPAFSTAGGTLGTSIAGNSSSYTITTTEPDGDTNTLAVTSGSVPPGMSFTDNANNTCTVSGTPNNPGSTTNYNFTVTATDTGGNTVSRSFTITISPPLAISSSSTSGTNNAYANQSTNNELQRQGTNSSNRKTLTINGSGIPSSGVTVTVDGQSCSNVSVNGAGTQITCTTPNADFGTGSKTVNVSESAGGQSVNSPNNITMRRYGENSNFPANSGITIQNNSDITNTGGSSQYWIRPSGYGGNSFQMYVSGNRDGGGYDYYLVQGGSGFSYTQQGNSCQGLGLDLAAPRSQGWWDGTHDIWGWREGTGNGGTCYVYKTGGGGNYTGQPMRQQSYWGNGHNAWTVRSGGRWWLRNNNHNEPNGDYAGYGNLAMYGQSGYPMGFNDGGAYGSGGTYVCSTNAKS